jgi:hypothetical protein
MYFKKFDYNQYMMELQNKLGDANMFNSNKIQVDHRQVDNSFTNQSRGFREKILQKLG